MKVPGAMAQQERAMTDQQTAGDGQNAPPPTNQQKQVTLELRKYILLLASLVATVTYTAGFSPPGDVWQDTAAGHLAGDPIIRDTHYKRYVAFFYCNATAFAASLVVIVLVLILASLDDKDNRGKYSNSMIALRTLQTAMVVDLLSLMGAYAAGTCRDTFTTVFSSVLVGVVFFYLVIQMLAAARRDEVEEAPATAPTPDPAAATCPPPPDEKDMAALDSVPGNNPQSSSGNVPKVDQDKANDRLRKVLMLLATFAVSITYSAGLSTPGGFWDTAGADYLPGDAILKERHNTRLAVFFGFNTLAFVASLLIIVVLLDTKLREINAYGFIVVVLVSLIGAYNAGSCRQTDTTVYVFSLIPAVVLYISFLLWVTKAMNLVEPPTPSVGASGGRENANDRESKTEEEKSAADKARSLVLLLATLAATITYQAGLDPPGGVWQDGHMAGDPILLTTNHKRYKAFFYCNSVSLVASLVAIVLVQKKLLLQHHVLEAVMILDLFGLIGAYAAGSCRDVNTSIHAMALAGAVLVYVVIHVILITLDDDTRRSMSESEKKKEKELVEKTRKRLLLFAILVATITYQAGLTPPGGFLLQDDQTGHHAGDPVLLYNFPRRYKAFFYCNSVSFMLSIALILLLVNPKLYRPAIRTHALSVCTAVGLFGLMGAYAAGSTQHIKTSIYIFVLLAVVIFFIILLFLVFWFTGCSTITKEEKEDNNNIKDKKKRVHAKRKYLMLLGILVASVTYQAGLAPPGGAWQSSNGGYEPGNPVMHDNRRPRYLAFFYSNSTSFMASIVVILLLLVPKMLFENKTWHKRWLVVMNTTLVLDLLGLLGAYAAGSIRRWKTSVYVLLLVIAVLAYMAFHLVLSCIIKQRNRNRGIGAPSSIMLTQQHNVRNSHPADLIDPVAIATPPV